MIKWENPLPDEDQDQWIPFTIKSKSGALIKGLSMSASPARATIVLGHPMGKDAKGYFLKNGYGTLYHNCGLNVVVFDFNGFGESTLGNFSYFEDIAAVGEFAVDQHPSLPLFYHGISMGGQWGTVAFAQNHKYDFALLESIPTTLEEFWIRYPIPYRVLKLLYFFMPVYAKKVRMIDRISELNRIRSLLLIYSETDTYTPASMGERFKNRSNKPAELWTVRNAEHAKIIKSDHKAEYEEKLIAFIKRCLHQYEHSTAKSGTDPAKSSI
jgi:pimeloyl-ACP methyl ester carboxylesterase